MNFDPALDQILFVYCQLERRMATKQKFRLYTLCAGMYTSSKSILWWHMTCLLGATTSKSNWTALVQRCHKASLHTILIGVIGTIHKSHTELPLSKLGPDRWHLSQGSMTTVHLNWPRPWTTKHFHATKGTERQSAAQATACRALWLC